MLQKVRERAREEQKEKSEQLKRQKQLEEARDGWIGAKGPRLGDLGSELQGRGIEDLGFVGCFQKQTEKHKSIDKHMNNPFFTSP